MIDNTNSREGLIDLKRQLATSEHKSSIDIIMDS